MIASMTAFTRSSYDTAWGNLVWEIKTVNHRYLEVGMRLPEILRSMETKIREQIFKVLDRGKVDINLKFIATNQLPFDFTINNELLAKMATLGKQVSSVFPNATVNMTDLLNWQGILQTQETHLDELQAEALVALDESLAIIVTQRQREGKGLQQFIEERLQQINQEIAGITELLPGVLASVKDKIINRFNEAQVELDTERLTQEMVWYAQKLDISEEVQRLSAHVKETQRVVAKGGAIGRRLDFLMQELNREANTIASKSVDTNVTRMAVELKVLIEQIREQVQNIE